VDARCCIQNVCSVADTVYSSLVYFATTRKWISILAFGIISLLLRQTFLLYRKFCTTKVLLENGLPDATEDKLPLPGQSHRVYSLDDKIFEDEYLSSCGQRSHSPRILTDFLQTVSGRIYLLPEKANIGILTTVLVL
jgi:hypothetical protein